MRLEDEIRKQDIQLTALREERDTLSRLSDELKMEIRLKEDKLDATKSDLQESLRKNKEGKHNTKFLKQTYINKIYF